MIAYVNRRSYLNQFLFFFFLALIWKQSAGQGGGADLSISRRVEKVGERQYSVEVTIHKGDLDGYAKLEEMVPEGFVASKEKVKGADYIFQDGKAKFIWMEFPKNEEFQVAYKLIQKQSDAGTYTIEGRISCVSSDGELLRVEKSSSFQVKAPGLASNKGSSTGKNGAKKEKHSSRKNESEHQKESGTAKNEGELASHDEASKKEGTSEEPEGKGTDEEKKGTEKGEKEKEEPSWEDTKSREGGKTNKDRYFSVQIGAFGEKKSDAYFQRRYGLSGEDIEHYREGEYHKYSMGRFGTYDRAQKEKKSLRKKGVKGAFVVGFKGEDPVSASELR